MKVIARRTLPRHSPIQSNSISPFALGSHIQALVTDKSPMSAKTSAIPDVSPSVGLGKPHFSAEIQYWERKGGSVAGTGALGGGLSLRHPCHLPTPLPQIHGVITPEGLISVRHTRI